MAQPAAPQALLTVGILALVAWRLYARIRRSIGRQRFFPRRPWVTIVVFPLLLMLLGVATRAHPQIAAALGGGVAVGVVLGIVGLHLTRFEITPEGRFYTPSAHLGVALSSLLVCRIMYRFFAYGLPGSGMGVAPPATPLTPLTLLLVGTLAGYYTTYAIGLLRWSFRTRAMPAAALPESPQSAQRS